MKIEILEIAGFVSALKALRLPHKLEQRSATGFNLIEDYEGTCMIECKWYAWIHSHDIKLMKALQRKGDSHAKTLRGIEVWIDITFPIYFMVEFDTYRIGCDTLSTSSTMLTDLKQLKGVELQEKKGNILCNYEYNRVTKISYQTLSRIYYDRKDHRLPEWKEFCEWIKTLPLAKELILCEG